MFRLFSLFLVFFSLNVYADTQLSIFVSIPPQKFLVERIGGNRVDVNVMLKPGHSPETYEPVPRQIAMLSRAQIYFRIGIPFEHHWMNVITAQNKDMLVIDSCCKSNSQLHDPHVWTSPGNAKIIAEQIRVTLIDQDPEGSSLYETNYQSLIQDLDELDKYIRALLSQQRTNHFIVSHDSWKYYADSYGLKQLALESFGREKGPRGLVELVELAIQEGIQTIFVQRQHPTGAAYTLANELNAKVVIIDPLAEEYIENLFHVTKLIAKAIQ